MRTLVLDSQAISEVARAKDGALPSVVLSALKAAPRADSDGSRPSDDGHEAQALRVDDRTPIEVGDSHIVPGTFEVGRRRSQGRSDPPHLMTQDDPGSLERHGAILASLRQIEQPASASHRRTCLDDAGGEAPVTGDHGHRPAFTDQPYRLGDDGIIPGSLRAHHVHR